MRPSSDAGGAEVCIICGNRLSTRGLLVARCDGQPRPQEKLPHPPACVVPSTTVRVIGIHGSWACSYLQSKSISFTSRITRMRQIHDRKRGERRGGMVLCGGARTSRPPLVVKNIRENVQVSGWLARRAVVLPPLHEPEGAPTHSHPEDDPSILSHGCSSLDPYHSQVPPPPLVSVLVILVSTRAGVVRLRVRL